MLCQSFFPDLSAPLLCRSYSHNLNDPVHVIGHDHKAVHINSSKMKRNRGPAFTSDPPKRGEFNACLAHSAKDAPLVIRADCHEVEAGSRIISVLQTSGNLRELQAVRSEEHTSELQSRQYLVYRLLLEKTKQQR